MQGIIMNQSIRKAIQPIAYAIIIATALSSAPAVFARTSSNTWIEPNESGLTSHRHYRNKSGEEVHSPSKTKSGDVPAGASAKCADGTYSFSRHHSGTCSRHGGVVQWE
jgi:hypothetical protein